MAGKSGVCEQCQGGTENLQRRKYWQSQEEPKSQMLCPECVRFSYLYQQYGVTKEELLRRYIDIGCKCNLCGYRSDLQGLRIHYNGQMKQKFDILCNDCLTVVSIIINKKLKPFNVTGYLIRRDRD